MSAAQWLLVCVAGGARSVLRLLVDEAVRGRWSHGFPAGIFVVNVTGSLLIGLLAGVLGGPGETVVVTGLLGGYTTFSTWMLDTHNALRSRDLALAAANVAGSLAAGLLAVHVGAAVA